MDAGSYLSTSGSIKGNSDSFKAVIDPSFWCTTGIGSPQYLCLETPQSFSLKLIFFSPNFFSSKCSIVFIIEFSCHFNPFKKFELKA